MSKAAKYAMNGAIIIGIGNLVINAIVQLNKMNENHNLKFDWTKLLKAGGKGAIIGGTGGAIIGSVLDFKNSLEEPFDTNSILAVIIANMRLDKEDPDYILMSNKADRIIRLIETNFKGKLGGPLLRIGSTEDNTALAYDFDIDISVPFKPDSYSSTAEMFDDLYDFFQNDFKDTNLLKVRSQRKSIGILYAVNGEEFKIDIVPYKLTKGMQSRTAGYLFVNNNSFFMDDSYIKTDIRSLKSLTLSSAQQKLLVAFKNWKQNNFIPISSHLLRLLILDAYDNNHGRIPRDFTKKILMIATHIEANIMHKRIVSLENTNNVLTDISNSDKQSIQKACIKILNDYEYQPNSILKHFQ